MAEVDSLALNDDFLTNIECCDEGSVHKESKESGVLDYNDVNLSPNNSMDVNLSPNNPKETQRKTARIK